MKPTIYRQIAYLIVVIIGILFIVSSILLLSGCESSILFIKGEGHTILETFQEDNKVDPELVIDDNAVIKAIDGLSPVPNINIPNPTESVLNGVKLADTLGIKIDTTQ